MENNKVFTALELITNEVAEMPCLFGNIIPKVGLCGVVGCSESGKSLFLRQLCISVATENEFIGLENKCTRFKALFVSTEDGVASTSFLMKKQNEYFHIQDHHAERIRFLFSPNNPIESIRQALEEDKVDVVVVDSFSDILDGKDEKSASDIRLLMKEYQKISEEYECLIVFLHHISKRSEFNAPNKNSVIGSQSFEAKCRLVLELRDDNADARVRHLCILKGNYIGKEEKQESYDLYLNDSLVFEPSNTRTPLAMLSISKQSKNSKSPNNIPDKVHSDFIKSIFMNNFKPLSGAEIKRAVIEYFTVGDTLSRQYLEYYRSKRFIIVDREGGNRTTFKMPTTD